MGAIRSLAFAFALLYFGGWRAIPNVQPKDVLRLALVNNVLSGGVAGGMSDGSGNEQSQAELLKMIYANYAAGDNGASRRLVGNYFLSEQGFGILINDQYYCAEITNRYFDSIALSWIAFILAMSFCGVGVFVVVDTK